MIKIKNDQKGFSLVELVIVIVILGIIAAIAIPRISSGSKGAGEAALKANQKNGPLATGALRLKCSVPPSPRAILLNMSVIMNVAHPLHGTAGLCQQKKRHRAPPDGACNTKPSFSCLPVHAGEGLSGPNLLQRITFSDPAAQHRARSHGSAVNTGVD